MLQNVLNLREDMLVIDGLFREVLTISGHESGPDFTPELAGSAPSVSDTAQ